MTALRDLVRARETRLWKETGGAAGIECPSEQAGGQIDHYTKLGFSPGGGRLRAPGQPSPDAVGFF